jgi:glycosyltransferase involved in cell wall biosynthesis
VRICIVTVAAHGIGGMQDHTRELARGLVAVGHEVDVIGPRHPEGIGSEESQGVRWWYVPTPSGRQRVPRRHPDWLRLSYRKFVELHEHNPFDVVHSESTSAIEHVRRGVHRRVPLVAAFHGSATGFARASLWRARRGDGRVKLREAKVLVGVAIMEFQYGHWYRFRPCEWMVPSQKQFEDTRRDAFLVRSRGHVVPNGVDVRRFRPRDRAQVRSELGLGEETTLVSVGRLNFDKGFDIALRAFARVRADVPDARFVVVGDGEEREALGMLSGELGLDSSVLFVGAQASEQVARYMAAADAVLFPTTLEEAAPLVLPQAMACGVPVIASRIGGIIEVIGPTGGNGILVPPGDTDALATESRALLADPNARARIGAAARARILAEYTLERMVERTLEVYEIAIRRLEKEHATR